MKSFLTLALVGTMLLSSAPSAAAGPTNFTEFFPGWYLLTGDGGFVAGRDSVQEDAGGLAYGCRHGGSIVMFFTVPRALWVNDDLQRVDYRIGDGETTSQTWYYHLSGNVTIAELPFDNLARKLAEEWSNGGLLHVTLYDYEDEPIELTFTLYNAELAFPSVTALCDARANR
ncbi:MAG: hypothetical protein SV201_15215 [Pseudomonadota bacterium]|nr:hypothetical protein [Pseudomonadota bacterium]